MVTNVLSCNPVDLARVGSLISLGGAAILDAAGAALMEFLGGAAALQQTRLRITPQIRQLWRKCP